HAGRIQGEMPPEVFQTKKQRADEGLAQLYEKAHVLVHRDALPAFQPLHMVAENAFLYLLTRPEHAPGSIQLPALRSPAALGGQFAGQRLRSEQPPLRPPLAGQVVEDWAKRIEIGLKIHVDDSTARPPHLDKPPPGKENSQPAPGPRPRSGN